MYPSREEFSELIFYISELKHQYTNKIDEQSTKINEQSMIIEELLWQIRELSDKIRQINQWKNNVDGVIRDSRRKFDEFTRSCVCRYENHIPKNRIVNSRQFSPGNLDQRENDKSKVSNNDCKNNIDDDDVYETIEFSDSSQHIYTEPFKNETNYGALRKISVKTVSHHLKQTTATKMINKRSVNSAPLPSKKSIKKSSRARNLQKFPGMQDVSKATDSDNDAVEDGSKVQLREKSPTAMEITSRPSKHLVSKQSNALVSDIEVEYIRSNRGNLESFTQQRDVSGILINFDCLNSRNEIN